MRVFKVLAGELFKEEKEGEMSFWKDAREFSLGDSRGRRTL